jgi:hypothetical protein
MALKKKVLFHYGCSFTDAFKHDYETISLLKNNYIYKNYGRPSANNKYILEQFKSKSEKDSICIIQWSSLTRPFDDNFKIVQTSDNPLFDLLEEWYFLIEDAIDFSIKNNIKLIQYIGWAEWKDDELNDYHREKLKSFGITWFESKQQLDVIASNCFQFQVPAEWSSKEIFNGLHKWQELKWGGMSEWVRENVEMDKRYIGWVTDEISNRAFIDPHPSKYANIKFIENFLLKELDKL